jgi:hypothetical protein
MDQHKEVADAIVVVGQVMVPIMVVLNQDVRPVVVKVVVGLGQGQMVNTKVQDLI